MTFPCKGCKYRVSGCHSFCKPYLEYREKYDIARQERKKRIVVVDYIMAQKRTRSRKRNLPKGGDQ